MKFEALTELTAEQQALLTCGRDMWSTAEIPEAGIPSRKMADGPMGISSGRVDERDVALLSPCGLCLAASWDTHLVGRIAELIGAEAARQAVTFVLAPNLNLPRSPLAGRSFELFSEDPLLTGKIGLAWILGLQSQGIGAVAKHIVCNDSETERHRVNCIVDERAMREVYLLPFEIAARGGCAGLLAAYNKVNGVHCVENSWLLTTVIREDWNFQGFTVSDWFGVLDTVASANAGLDLDMPGVSRFFGSHLLAAIEQGKVAPERMAAAARRVATAAAACSCDRAVAVPKTVAAGVLREAAAAGFCLVQNSRSILPLDPSRRQRIAIIGPNATAPCFQGGSFAKISIDPDALTPLEAIRERWQDRAEITYQLGTLSEPRLPSLPARPAKTSATLPSRGMLVEYFDSQEFTRPPVASEIRDTNSLTWFTGLEGNLIVTDRAAAIRISGYMLPDLSGNHEFFAGATGSVRLSINGTLLMEEAVTVAPADLMGRLKSGDAKSASYPLEQGQEVLVSIEFLYQPGRAHGVWFGARRPQRAEALLNAAVEDAASAELVILMVGETADASVESKDRSTSALPPSQIRLIERVCAANRNTVVVVNTAHATDLSWRHAAAAVLLVWYPGEQFGQALAEVLAGDREPGGRLPVTIAEREQDYPAFNLTPDADVNLVYQESWRIGYRGFAARNLEPAFALGSGLGYATFAYLNAEYDPDTRQAAVTLKNTSARDGKEVVQVFTTHHEDGLTTPILVGFQSVWLQSGETKELIVGIDERAFQHWDTTEHRWIPSSFRSGLKIGSCLSRIHLEIAQPAGQRLAPA